MAQTYRQRFLAVMRQNEQDMKALFSGLHGRIERIVLSAASGDDGTIPPQDSERVRQAVGAEVLRAFLTSDNGGNLRAFDVVGGRVVPQSPYMRVLHAHIESVTRLVVEQQASIMRRALRGHDDIIRAFESAQRNPFAVAQAMQEQAQWEPRRYLGYDPLHRFADARGYVLSTRVWDTATVTRRKVDALLAEAIAEGRGARDIAKELEAFLLPGRKIKRTKLPYGTDASYDAMRLARTEITAAHARAGRIAAHANPFVNGADWVLSPAHGCCDICDVLAAGSPYTLDKLPDLPGDSHPQCWCHYRWHTVASPAEVVADLRRQRATLLGAGGMPGGAPLLLALIGPLAIERFTRLLLGDPIDEPEWIA